jgi:ferredoxin
VTRASAEDGDVDTEKCIQCIECIDVCQTSAINASYRFNKYFKEYITVQKTDEFSQ